MKLNHENIEILVRSHGIREEIKPAMVQAAEDRVLKYCESGSGSEDHDIRLDYLGAAILAYWMEPGSRIRYHLVGAYRGMCDPFLIKDCTADQLRAPAGG